jgi:N-acetylmuramoyl-L-alanine amidase
MSQPSSTPTIAPPTQENSSATPGSEQQPTQEQKTTPPQTIQKAVGVVKQNDVGYLNVRDTGSANGKLLGRLNTGDKRDIIKEQGDWTNIKLVPPLNGQTEGWVATIYLEKTTETVVQ